LLPVFVAATTIFLGCHSYQFGARSLYASDVATVYVPIFASESFHPEIAKQLTEAVVKEIQLKTHYRVVGTADADSILTGRVISDSRRVLVEDFNDRPRELELNYQVQVTWLNRRRMPMHEATLDLPPELVGIGQATTQLPEAGQSFATSQQLAVQRLAEQIVATMEEPW
jgi:hypothetical protein